jgi:hypothetical protein
MVNYLDTKSDAKRFAAQLADYELRLQALERTSKAKYTSIQGGTLDIYNEDGELAGSVGVQPDGGIALVPEAAAAAPPPTPGAPTVAGALAGLVVTWDGWWDDADAPPTDFAALQVHVGPAADFTPDVTTLAAAITDVTGGSVTIAVEGYADRWVRLVALNTAGLTSAPSAAAVGKARQAVEQDLIDGIVSEVKLADDAVTRAKLALAAVSPEALAPVLADTVSQRWTDTMDDPNAWLISTEAGASFTFSSVADAPSGGSVGRSAGYTNLRSTTLIPYDPNTLYRVSFRVRAVAQPAAGPDTVYLGLMGVAADKVTMVNRVGANSTGSHFYCAASNDPVAAAAGWQVWTGFVQGRTAAGVSATGAKAADPLAPGLLHDQVRYVAPYMLLNYSRRDPAGVIEIDSVAVEALRTGVVTSAYIAANAVVAEKILAGAVTTAKIDALAITAEKIAALAVTTDKLSALAVTADKLAANSVTATKILAGAIDATHIKVGSLTADRLSLGVDGNLIADPSFEGELSVQRVAVSPSWSIVTPGNGTPKAMQVNATAATPTSRAMTLAFLPAVPGTKVWLSVDYLASEDWAGTSLWLYAQWQDASGAVLANSELSTGAADVVRGAWTKLSGVPPLVAPPGTTQLRVAVASNNGTAGTVAWDNAAARIVLASGTSGARAELSPQGLQLFDDTGEEAVALVTGRPNYLTLSTAGTPVATIDQDGAAGFQSLAVAEGLTVGGTNWMEYLDQYARGIQAIDYQSSTVTASASELGFVEIAVDIDVTRTYRFVFEARANPSAAGGELQIRLRNGGAGSPTITSPQLHVAVWPMAIGNSFTCRLEHVVTGKSLGAGNKRFLITFVNALGPSGQTIDMYGGTGSLGKFYCEDVGPYIPETGQYNTGGGSVAPPVQKYTKTYSASWSGSYANRGSYNSYYGNKCLQGYVSPTNGIQAALIGFPSALGTDLSGATILKAEVYLYFEHWYGNAGGSAVIKAHKHTSRPSTFSSDSESKTISWKRNEGKWVDITSVFDSTSWRGIALDPNSQSSTYYGVARGVGQTYPPKLKVTYTK